MGIPLTFYVLRCAIVLLTSAALHGCAWYIYDVTNRPIASNIAGMCFELREDAILAEYYGNFGRLTTYALNLPGANECTPEDVTPRTKDEERYKSSGLDLPKCAWIPVAKIANGTTLKVTDVTEQPRGAQWAREGIVRCWKVNVTLMRGPYAGTTAGIPACSFDFPESQLWLRMKSAQEYVKPLELSDRVARPCTD